MTCLVKFSADILPLTSCPSFGLVQSIFHIHVITIGFACVPGMGALINCYVCTSAKKPTKTKNYIEYVSEMSRTRKFYFVQWTDGTENEVLAPQSLFASS